MKHKKIEELIVLAHYEETAPEEKTIIEEHLRSCRACSEFSRRLDDVFPGNVEGPSKEVDRSIGIARNEFRRALVVERHGTGINRRLPASNKMPGRVRFSVPAYALAGAAVLLMAAGLLTGYLLRGGGNGTGATQRVISELSARSSGNMAITDVRFEETNRKSKGVKLSFNVVKRYEMDGSLDDPNIQRVLAYALVNSDNAGVRLRTIGMLDASPRPDTEIENALIKALKTDDNAGVRREALLSLKKLPFDSRIKEAMLYVLQNDKNPGMRVAAINLLADSELAEASGSNIDPQVLKVLKEKSSSDQNRYVRLKAADMLKELKEL